MWDGFVGDSIYLDTNVIILAIEEGNPWTDSLRELFEAIDENAIRAFTSEMTLAEVLAKPLSLSDGALIEKYNQLLAPESALKVIPIDRPILRAASQLQGELGIKLMDSIHIATAQSTKCDFFLSQDQRLGHAIRERFRWIQLSDVHEGSP